VRKILIQIPAAMITDMRAATPPAAPKPVSVTAFLQGVEITYPYNYSAPEGSVTEGSASVAVPTATFPDANGVYNYVGTGSDIAALKQYNLSGVVRAMQKSLSGHYRDVGTRKSRPAEPANQCQREARSHGYDHAASCGARGTINGTSTPIHPVCRSGHRSYSGYVPALRGMAIPYSLLALGEDTLDWRMLAARLLLECAHDDTGGCPTCGQHACTRELDRRDEHDPRKWQ